MNDLNKQQTILLAILVSFVVSIATGVTVVSLLVDQTPEPFTQTVNRIVEKTIERVVPDESDRSNSTTQKTPEKEIVTVVVNQEDLTIEAIEKNSGSFVRIFQGESFLTGGLIVKGDGSVIADKSKINLPPSNYKVVTNKGSFSVENIENIENSNFVAMKLSETGGTTFSPVKISQSPVQLGQTIISLSGITKDSVDTGIVTSVEGGGVFETSVDGSSLSSGSILINLSGEVVGIKLSQSIQGVGSFTPSSQLSSAISAF